MDTAQGLRDRILALAVKAPHACSMRARKILATDRGFHQFSILCELIGYEYSRRVFDGISESVWERLRLHFYDHLSSIRKEPVAEYLSELHTQFLGAVLSGDSELRRYFDKFRNLAPERLRALLGNQSPARLALLSTEWAPQEMDTVLAVLPRDKQREVILHVARLQRLPSEVLEGLSRDFASELDSALIELEANAQLKPVPPPFREKANRPARPREVSPEVPTEVPAEVQSAVEKIAQLSRVGWACEDRFWKIMGSGAKEGDSAPSSSLEAQPGHPPLRSAVNN